jgi:hypothetical protein
MSLPHAHGEAEQLQANMQHPHQNDLERYYCGTIALAELETIETHLRSCQHCRLRLDSIRRFVDWLVLGADRESRPQSVRQHVT